jgi:hypothetical protein
MSSVRYARWQLRDWLVERLPAPLFVGLLLATPFILRVDQNPEVSASARRMLNESVIPIVIMALILFAVHGIISLDRTQGHVHFLLSKPIRITAFYVQKFAVHGAGVLTAVALLLLLQTWKLGESYHVNLLIYAAASYVLMGGVGFLFSTFTRFDGPLLIGVWLLTSTLQNEIRPAGGVWHLVAQALPPTGALRSIQLSNPITMPIEPSDILWPLVYGIAAIALGCVLLRRRPLTR